LGAAVDAIARTEACLADHGDAIYLTHRTVLSLFVGVSLSGP
jgi:hypothetical protein